MNNQFKPQINKQMGSTSEGAVCWVIKWRLGHKVVVRKRNDYRSDRVLAIYSPVNWLPPVATLYIFVRWYKRLLFQMENAKERLIL